MARSFGVTAGAGNGERFRAAAVALGVSWLSLVASAPAASAEEAVHGAAFTESHYTDPHTGAEAPMMLFYPTRAAEREVTRGPLVISAAPDAAPKPGKWPLIMLSHGWGGSRRGHADTALELARYGFVVAAIEHVGNSLGDNSLGTSPERWRVRPAQFAAALDVAAALPQVDGARVGAIGFSMGGYTVLAALGGRADPRQVVTYCGNHAEDVGFCGIRSSDDRAAASPGGNAPAIAHAPDRRIKAAVLMAPAAAAFVDGGLAKIDVPIRLYRAERDERVGVAQYEMVRDGLGRPPEYVVVPNAGHFGFMAPVAPGWEDRLGEVAMDPPGFDRAAFHERLNAELVAFFRRELR